MLLDEAIKHCKEVAEEKEKEGKLLCDSEAGSNGCLKCAEEHRQLAEWLKDYKQLLEQEPIDKSDLMCEIYMKGVNMTGEYQGCWVRFKDIEKIVDKYMGGNEE